MFIRCLAALLSAGNKLSCLECVEFLVYDKAKSVSLSQSQESRELLQVSFIGFIQADREIYGYSHCAPFLFG